MIDSPGLYVHIPFCVSRCGYCTFVSALYRPDLADAYLDALENEWTSKRGLFARPPSTLFIGGGTPSALSLGQLERLLRLLPRAEGEATCELNPETASSEKLSLLHDHGINRVSFGAQTFSPAGREVLERRHGPEDVFRAVAEAQRVGFRSVNLDLINGWPGQDAEAALEDLRISVDLEIQHISYYALILDDEARAFHKLSNLLKSDYDDKAREIWDRAEEFLARRGFAHYETSNYARPGFCCRHNVMVWKGGEYLGLGLAAHSHWGGRRFGNLTDLGEYVARGGLDVEAFSERLEGKAKARETALFWLRLFAGIDRAEFRHRTGYELSEIYDRFPPGVESTADRVWVPPHLQPVLDAILVDMV